MDASNDAYAGTRKSAWNYVQAGGSATVPMGRGWYLKPHVEITGVVDGTVRRASGSGAVFNAGLAFGF